GGVFSSNPASDASTTVADESLVGFWRAEASEAPRGGAEAATSGAILAVGRSARSKSALTLVTVALGADGRLDRLEYEVWTTSIGNERLASVFLHTEGASSVIVKYEHPDDDTLHIIDMEEKAVADDLRAGRV